MKILKILSIIFLVLFVAIVLYFGSIIYTIERKVDYTPIVKIPFDPSKKDIIKLENFKMPRGGKFILRFCFDRKDKSKEDRFKDLDYLRDKNLNIKYKISVNGKELINETNKSTFPAGWTYRIELNSRKFRKNDVLNIIIENQRESNKFDDFNVTFDIVETKGSL